MEVQHSQLSSYRNWGTLEYHFTLILIVLLRKIRHRKVTSPAPEPTMGFTYDPASQVTNILHQLGATGPTINQAAYTYNGVGNRESLTDRRGIQNFGYDNLDRLTSASHPLLGTPQAFAYDAVRGGSENSDSVISGSLASPTPPGGAN